MGEAAALLGSGGATFAFGGRRLPVHERNLDIEALLETYLEGRALEALGRHRGRLADEDYLLALRGWQQDCAAGAYAWGEPACLRAVGRIGSPGWRELAYLQLKCADAGATRDLVDEACKDAAAARELDAALWRANGPFPSGGPGPSPSAPSAPSSNGGATAAAPSVS